MKTKLAFLTLFLLITLAVMNTGTQSASALFRLIPVTPTTVVPKCAINDGRLNCFADQLAQPFAVYCDNGGVDIWSVTDGKGALAFKISSAELNAVPKNPNANTLIKKGAGLAVYRLTGGQLQINGGSYVFIWNQAQCG